MPARSSCETASFVPKLKTTNAAAHPADRDTLLALVDLLRESGNRPAALRYARDLGELLPGDPTAATLIESLQPGP